MPDLQTLFNTVPIANSGDVVTEEYHNSLRDTLGAVVNQLSVGIVSQIGTLTFQPAFVQNDVGPNWSQKNGNASLGSTGVANGWLPVQFPDGARIQKMAVIGLRSGSIAPASGQYTITLYRQAIVDSTQFTVLVLIDWSKDIGSNTISAPLQVPGAGPGANEEFKLVDNTNYKFYIIATVVGATAGVVAEIHSIKVDYTKS